VGVLHEQDCKELSAMTDLLTPAQRSANMSKIRGKNTRPELAVRKLLFRLGYRYRLHDKTLPGKPDIVFSGRQAVVYVHGCFWHRHENGVCKNAVLPKTRPEFWEEKLQRNAERDRQHVNRMEALGWRVLVVWECEVGNLVTLREKLTNFLGSTKSAQSLTELYLCPPTLS
jgi:DNA mismatch endonuclease (patch repair protein)